MRRLPAHYGDATFASITIITTTIFTITATATLQLLEPYSSDKCRTSSFDFMAMDKVKRMWLKPLSNIVNIYKTINQ